MDKIFIIGILILYCPATLWLFFYGINSYYMVYLFFKKEKKERSQNTEFLKQFWSTHSKDTLPRVTTQLPVYNERYVVERLINAVVNINYPQKFHDIQILDDSTDETRDIVARLVDKYTAMGFIIKQITRNNRNGFKAGALHEGLQKAEGEFLAIFDADFIPDKDFFYRTIPFFYEREKVALVQTRWGHANKNYSLLTIAQSIGIDGHFIIEQGARTWNGLYMNFNGTAGIWKKEAIIDAGGWHHDTLTEDLDLSYRVQLKGWRTKFLFDVVTPAELPIDINAYKTQQHRWAKGSIQTAKKILPQICKSQDTLIKKIEAFIHLTQYMVHPMMIILALLSYPLIILLNPSVNTISITTTTQIMWCFVLSGTFAPSFLYIISQKIGYKDWWKRSLFIPILMLLGCGIAVNNTKAVLEALLNVKSDFVRTPKFGVVKQGKRLMAKNYISQVKLIFVSEILLSLYCFTGYMMNHTGIFEFFILLYAVSFFYVGTLSLLQKYEERIKY